MKKLLIALIVMTTTIGCYNHTDNKNQKTEVVDFVQKQKNDSIEKAKADSLVRINNEKREEDKKRLEILKKKFNFKRDEFNDSEWYANKKQADTYGKCLMVHVNSDGYIYLEDQYYAEDWIFHTRIEVKIGENVYKSENVETYSEDNKTTNDGGSVWENISYTGNKDNGIIKAIAESGNMAVKVRFVGRQYNSDFTLANRDKQSIKEGYELSELLKKIGK